MRKTKKVNLEYGAEKREAFSISDINAMSKARKVLLDFSRIIN
ncbi:MAG: hypothetical protein U5K00_15705 [Melioribacteraceae bacterium]|nr:hypothetical protein [Melioribacteraceae bacterium]